MKEKEVRGLLSKLCIELGFCLPLTDIERLAENPPTDALSFTDAVILAEGLVPDEVPRRLYRQVRDMIAGALDAQ